MANPRTSLASGAALLFVALFVRTSRSDACSPVMDIVPSCPESVRGLCDALRGSESLEKKRAAVREALLAADPKMSEAARHLFASAANQMDLRPYADIFSESCAAQPRCFWTGELEDWSRLRFDPLQSRVELFEHVIRSGSVKLPGGLQVSRSLAVQMAAWQGLDELRPLAEEYLATLTDRYKSRFGLDNVVAFFELTGGADTPPDAHALAAARLEAMPDEDLQRRMEAEEPFRKAVLAEAGFACRYDVLTGRASPACGRYAGIVERQKRRYPGSAFSYGCGSFGSGDPLPKWLDALYATTRAAPADAALEAPSPSAQRGSRPTGIDPCTLPEIPEAERWTPGPTTVGGYYVIVRDLSPGIDGAVSVADGIRGHESARTIRLKLDLRNRSGGRPTYPVVMRVSLAGKGGGSLSAPGRGQGCASMNFFWNRAASNETSLVDFDEVDLTLGAAQLAGTIPDEETPRKPVLRWRATSELQIHVARIREEDGSATLDGAAVFDVRPEGVAVLAQAPRPFDGLLTRKPEELAALFFGPDLGEDQIIVRDPTRQFVALVDRDRTDDTRPIICFSQRENGARVTQGEAVTLRRLGDSPIFVGTFIAMPEGYPGPDTEIGRPLQPPSVVIPLGRGDVGCEDPSSP